MKNLRVLILCGLVVGLGLTSCVKEAADQPASTTLDNGKAIVARITQFHEAVSGDLKTDRPLSVDSVVWYTEADINYYYCVPYEEYNYTTLDSFLLEAETDEYDMVEAEDYNRLYDAMIDSLGDFWHSIDEDPMYMVVVDVSVKSVNDGVATLKIVGAIGYGAGMYTPDDFGDEDYWTYGFGGGKCGPYSGSLGLDAAILIANKIRSQTGLQQYIAYEGICSTIPPIHPFDYPTNDPNNPDDNYCDFLLYYSMYYGGQLPQNYVQCDFCLDPDEMNFYYDGTDYVYNNENPDPSVLDNIFIYLEPKYTYGMPEYSNFHFGHFSYGKPYSTLLPSPILTF
ncbi:MAG: hypothetical protein K9H64_21880 [Bacteroidales bacterium]|nr:hypothetical protein [Bacteroidales bacterium]MCF8458690.1 hypothetical protein [Bacteroidales bacterium]